MAAESEMPAPAEPKRPVVAGAIVRFGAQRLFVPAEVGLSVVRKAVISRVPGSALSMALLGGRVTSVVDLGERGEELLVCDVEGEPIALAGLKVEGSGFYEASGDGAVCEGEHVPRLDVAAEVRRLEGRLLDRASARAATAGSP